MTFSLPVKQQGVRERQAAETPTCLSLIKVKMQSHKEIEEVTNLTATALYCDLIPIVTFSNTACCTQLHSWSNNPKCTQLLEKYFTSYNLYFLNLNTHEMLNFVRVWVWCNTRRSCFRLVSNENRIKTTEPVPVTTEIQLPKFPRFPTMCKLTSVI